MSDQGDFTTVSPTAADIDRVFALIRGYHVSQAIRVAIELGISDHLAGGPTDIDDLAAKVGADVDHLHRLMRFLSGAGLYHELASRRFGLRPMGRALCQGAPGSPSVMARFLMHDALWQSWGGLLDAVKTGKTAFDSLHGASFFEYMSSHADLGALFDKAMTERTSYDAQHLAAAYDFSGTSVLADIGGGQGVMLSTLLAANPSLHGILFDQPDVVARAGPVLSNAGVTDRCRVVGGSFFDEIPAGASLYLLSRVIHDWDDERASMILARLRAAMAPTSRVLLYERHLTPTAAGNMVVLHTDMEMMVNLGGRERTPEQYRSLLKRSGLQLDTVHPVPKAPNYILIEASPTGADRS